MHMPLADVADRYTILLLKLEHGLKVQEDLGPYIELLDWYAVDYTELMRINRRMWDLENEITAERDLARIGALYLALRKMTVKRVEAKNRIAQSVNQPQEAKNY